MAPNGKPRFFYEQNFDEGKNDCSVIQLLIVGYNRIFVTNYICFVNIFRPE